MKCISSPALDDTQIIRYLEGEADDTVVAHIKECVFCREKASRWAHLQNRLRKQVYRAACPSSMELGDYHLGLLSDPQELVIAQHLRECPLCRREVAELEDFLTDPGPETSFLEGVKVLVARLINQAENGYTPASVALRGEAKGPLTFEADGIVIVLDIQPTEAGKVNILGQVAADDQEQWNGAVVQLRQAETLLTSSMDDLGAFNFEAIHLGLTQMTITSPQGTVVRTPEFDIKV